MTHPQYKSLKVLFTTWQTITRICAITGEARATVVTRLAADELARLRQQARDTALGTDRDDRTQEEMTPPPRGARGETEG